MARRSCRRRPTLARATQAVHYKPLRVALYLSYSRNSLKVVIYGIIQRSIIGVSKGSSDEKWPLQLLQCNDVVVTCEFGPDPLLERSTFQNGCMYMIAFPTLNPKS